MTDVSLDCSSQKCLAEGGPNQIQCCSCQRWLTLTLTWVHYKCTQLPPYMLQAFIAKRIKKYYFCKSCVVVPKKLKEDFYPQSKEQDEIERLRREVSRCENLIKVAEENSGMANELLSEKINQIDESKIEKIKDLKLEKFSSILEKHKESKKFHTLASQIQHQVTLKQL